LHYLNKKIILFNGPPRSGKDTIITELLSCYPLVKHLKFSNPLKKSIPAFFDVKEDELEKNKDEKNSKLLGLSYRDVQISLSEGWAKPVFGKDVFGKIMVSNIVSSNFNMFFISDCGFYEETKLIIDTFGEKNCLLVRLHRTGTDFSKDSRSYWNHDFKKLSEATVYNNSSINSTVVECMSVIDKWLEETI
jgi:guanylate kinase